MEKMLCKNGYFASEECMKPGKSDEWYTPKYFFDAFKVEFDLDPCHPDQKTFVPVKQYFTKEQDGLSREWKGLVWMNPPFGRKNGYFKWVEKFLEHGNGIGLFTALTSSQGFQKYIPQMDAIVFPKTKTKFVRPDGEAGGCPFNGIVLFAKGEKAVNALESSGLGIFLKISNKECRHEAAVKFVKEATFYGNRFERAEAREILSKIKD